ncbi:MAG: VOC family protein [Candidatus Korobacteraceae bacterium]
MTQTTPSEVQEALIVSKTMGPISLSWVPQGSFHHVGFVVKSIQESAESFAASLNAAWDGEIIDDPNQVVRVTFLHGDRPADPLIELIEPAGDRSPVLSFLQRGGGLHHLCYQVEKLEEQLRSSRAVGGIITRPPLPAVAFGGRRIAWVYTKNKLLIEYLES